MVLLNKLLIYFKIMNKHTYTKGFTNDAIIRSALMRDLEKRHSQDKQLRIIEELGVRHGAARIDIVVINGIMHGYEIKSDRDTLERLPEQIEEYNTVFDKLTLVVGKHHINRAISQIPDWWGILLVKVDIYNRVILHTIREPETNKHQESISMARLLWREEALQILKERNKAKGVLSKPRENIYERLANVLEINELKEKVYNLISSREGWRSSLVPMSNGD